MIWEVVRYYIGIYHLITFKSVAMQTARQNIGMGLCNGSAMPIVDVNQNNETQK